MTFYLNAYRIEYSTEWAYYRVYRIYTSYRGHIQCSYTHVTSRHSEKPHRCTIRTFPLIWATCDVFCIYNTHITIVCTHNTSYSWFSIVWNEDVEIICVTMYKKCTTHFLYMATSLVATIAMSKCSYNYHYIINVTIWYVLYILIIIGFTTQYLSKHSSQQFLSYMYGLLV